MLSSQITGNSIDRDDAAWIVGDGSAIRNKLAAVGLVEPAEPIRKSNCTTLAAFLDDFLERNGPSKKPATRVVWGQVIAMLNRYMPKGTSLDDVTKGHAKAFLEKLKQRGLASTTIHKRIGFARQFFQDAVDWEWISSNPFQNLKTQTSSKKSNVEVPRESIDRVLEHCDITWKTIVCLSRYGGLRCPSETLSLRWSDIDFPNGRMYIQEPKVEHHEGRGIRECPLFPELRAILEEASELNTDSSEFVVNKPAYRAAAMREGGWANANLRTQFKKILKRANVEPWARLFHSMRASRQTELEREYPLHVVCSWIGNSEAVAKKNYLLVTAADFEKENRSEIRGTNPTRADAKTTRRGTKTTLQDARRIQQDSEENPGNTAKTIVFPSVSGVSGMEDNGLEPMTSCMPCKRSPN